MKQFLKVIVSTVAALVGLVAVLWLAVFVLEHTPRSKGLNCNNNLRQIDAAKEQAAQQFGLTNGQVVTVEQVVPYLKGGVLPRCRSGGTYALNPIGKTPTCSLGDPSAEGEKNWWHRLPD